MKYEYLGGSEAKEAGYNSERAKISESTRKRLGHFASQGVLFKSDSVF